MNINHFLPTRIVIQVKFISINSNSFLIKFDKFNQKILNFNPKFNNLNLF